MFVLKVKNDIIQRIMVKERIIKDNFTEVYGHLEEADTIVVNGSEEMREGTKAIMKQEGTK